MRKKIVAGNWKMNTTLEEGISLANEICEGAANQDNNGKLMLICPPFTHLKTLSDLITKTDVIKLGAQNCHWESGGAYTGETSLLMLHTVGVSFILVGHSERRQYFNETNKIVKLKADASLASGIIPIFCCGEPLEKRKQNEHYNFVGDQIKESLFHLSASEFGKIVIAYEPIWAIGTGETASSGQAQEMHLHIRNMVNEKYNAEIAGNLTILYGGSCNAANSAELFSQPDVDGGLIGGASLKAADFLTIFKNL